MSVRVDSLQDDLAARLTGVDLEAGVDDLRWRDIEAAWRRFPVLVFSGQPRLSIRAHVSLLERFGPVIEERMPGEKHSFVSNALGKGTDEMNAGYREGELTPHMDYTYTPYPADVISLFAEQIPAEAQGGATTRFYSNAAPLRRMPRALRERLPRYTIFCAHDLATMRPDARLFREPRTRADAPTQSHTWPLVRRHPRRRGLDVLCCSLQQTERIVELSDAARDDVESRALLGELFDRWLYVPENEYAHAWRPGDLVVWDNLAVQHAREPCPLGVGERSFRRVAVCEAGNAIAETVRFLGLADASVAFA